MASKSPYICARCKVPVGYWFYGWKHQTGGWKPKPTCGLKPLPEKKTSFASEQLKGGVQ